MTTFVEMLRRELAPPAVPKGPVALDLFSGAGGLTLGLKSAGVRTFYALEKEPYRACTFHQHTPTAHLLISDIREVQFAAYRGQVELVYGGPPCQPFSTGGLRKAEADERNMIPQFLRAVREIRPRAFLMENVPGLIAGDRLHYLTKIIRQFEESGFTVTWQVVNAADFGVPQKRRRLLVVGLRDQAFVFPKETHGPGRLYPQVAVRDALPEEPVGEPNPSRVFYAKKPDLRPNPHDGHLFNGGGRAIALGQPCHTILASAGGNKTHFFDPLGLVPEYHQHLLAGGAPRLGVLPGARRLTVQESAYLQTFPPGIVFSGPRSAQYHQVGDAVPPRLAAAIGRALVAQLLGKAETEPKRRGNIARSRA